MAQPGRTVAQVRDPFADVPVFDPTRLASENPPPPPKVPADPPDEDERVRAAKQKYLDSIEALASADSPKKIHEQTVEIQRRRCVWMLTREAVEGVSDPDVLKELHTLSKLNGGAKAGGFEDDEDSPERLLEQSAAEDLLKERGVTPESAGRLLRVLASLNGAGGTGSGTDNDAKFASAFAGRGPTGAGAGPAERRSATTP